MSKPSYGCRISNCMPFFLQIYDPKSQILMIGRMYGIDSTNAWNIRNWGTGLRTHRRIWLNQNNTGSMSSLLELTYFVQKVIYHLMYMKSIQIRKEITVKPWILTLALVPELIEKMNLLFSFFSKKCGVTPEGRSISNWSYSPRCFPFSLFIEYIMENFQSWNVVFIHPHAMTDNEESQKLQVLTHEMLVM